MMDGSWNNITTDQTVLQQIASDLGYNSVDDLPPVHELTADQVATLTIQLPTDVTEKLLAQDYDYENPDLDAADLSEDDDPRSLAVQLQSLVADLTSTLMDMAKKVSDMTMKDLRQQSKDRIKKVVDAIKKMIKQKKAAFWKKFGAWAGAVAGFLGALALTIVTGGAAVPALIVASIALGLQIAQSTGAMDKLETAMFGDNQKAKMIFEICLTVAILVAGIATGAYAARAASSVTEITALAEGIANLANASSEAVTAGARVMGIGATVVGILASIGGGAASIDAAFAERDQKEIQKDLAKILAMIDSLKSDMKDQNDKIKKILQFYMQFGSKLPESILKSISETNQSVLASSPA